MLILNRLSDAFEKSAFLSYAIVLAAAGKTVWDMWLYRDLSTGDTSSYFSMAVGWFEGLNVNILWSPLYTAFYGQTLFATHSAYGATALHRIIIVIAADLGVLALLRRLMPPGIALPIALWWTILPINFDALYEVHLFALLPMLVVLIVASSGTVPLQRGVILALLLGITVLVRNETAVALIVFAGFCLFEEAVQPFGKEPRTAAWWKQRSFGYAVPLFAVVALIVFCYARSTVKYPEIAGHAQAKHTQNMCQVYAFGYAQRHPDFTASPWIECKALMQQTFGSEAPSLFGMMRANPAAVFEHFYWNLGLALNGFQVALFNGMSGSVNPDYAAVREKQAYAAVLSIIAALILMGGGWRLWRSWTAIKPKLTERRHLVAIYACLACVVTVIILTQRPRPSYLFPFTVCIMALIGLSADLLTQGFTRRVNIAGLLIGMAVVIFLPFYQSGHASSRPLYTNLLRLQPYWSELARGDRKLLLGDYADEVANYLQLDIALAGRSDAQARRAFLAKDYSVLNAWDRREPLDAFLQRQKIDVILVQPRVMAELQQIPAARNLLEGRSEYARLNSPFDRDWALLAILPPPGLPKVLEQVGWLSEGVYEDGWLAQNGFVEVRAAEAGKLVLHGMVPGGIGLEGQQFEISSPTGTRIQRRLAPGPFDIELSVQPGHTRLTFAFEQAATLPAGDGRRVAALLQSSVIEPRQRIEATP